MLFNFLSGFRTYVCASFRNRWDKLKTPAWLALARILLAVFSLTGFQMSYLKGPLAEGPPSPALRRRGHYVLPFPLLAARANLQACSGTCERGRSNQLSRFLSLLLYGSPLHAPAGCASSCCGPLRRSLHRSPAPVPSVSAFSAQRCPVPAPPDCCHWTLFLFSLDSSA